MNNFLKITSGLSVMPLLLAIRRRPELWHADTYLRDYPQGPFGDTETIMLRFPVKRVADTEAELKDVLSTYDQHENIDYPAYALLHEARPLVMDLMAFVKGERLGRVMINKLRPGGRIFPHEDTPAHAEYWTRMQIVLSATPGCIIRCGDEQLQYQAGDCFYFNNKIEHSVENNSATDRISMVVDIRTSR